LKKKKIKISSNKSFGIVFFVVFLIISFFPMLKGESFRTWSLVLALIFLILGVLKSPYLSPLNNIWNKFGLLLGKVISPIVMGIIFFAVVTPIAYLMRLIGKDILGLKKNDDKSYWIEKKGIKSKMKDQF
jgi:hypothetical protein